MKVEEYRNGEWVLVDIDDEPFATESVPIITSCEESTPVVLPSAEPVPISSAESSGGWFGTVMYIAVGILIIAGVSSWFRGSPPFLMIFDYVSAMSEYGYCFGLYGSAAYIFLNILWIIDLTAYSLDHSTESCYRAIFEWIAAFLYTWIICTIGGRWVDDESTWLIIPWIPVTFGMQSIPTLIGGIIYYLFNNAEGPKTVLLNVFHEVALFVSIVFTVSTLIGIYNGTRVFSDVITDYYAVENAYWDFDESQEIPEGYFLKHEISYKNGIQRDEWREYSRDEYYSILFGE